MNRREFDQCLTNGDIRKLAAEALVAKAEFESAREKHRTAVGDFEEARRALTDLRPGAGEHESQKALALVDRALAHVKILEESYKAAEAKVDQATDDGSALNQKWQQLWWDEIALLVRSDDQKAVPFKSWRELINPVNPLPPLVPWLDGCMRQIRRLFALIAREPMVEERTFSDYRLALEQRIEGLQSEISSVLKGISLASRFLQQVKKGNSDLNKAPAIGALQGVLDCAEVQAKALLESVGAPTFKSEMADGLRPLWHYVDEKFGTWQRRVQPPLVAGFRCSLLAVLAYVLVGAYLPTTWISVPLFAIVIWRTLATYWGTRFSLDEAIQHALSKLNSLRADGEGQSDTIWRLTPQHDRAKLVTELHAQVASMSKGIQTDRASSNADRHDQDSQKGKAAIRDGKRVLRTAVMGVAALGFMLVGLNAAPRYALIESSAQGDCTLVAGSVVWPGPHQLLLLEGGAWARLNVFPVSRVSRIARESGAPESCRPIIGGSLALHSTIVEYPNQVERNQVLVIPIFPEPVHCPNPRLTTGISPAGKEMIGLLGKAIMSCGDALHVVRLDVRGFASSKEFPERCDTTGELNWKLAEARRVEVIHELQKAVKGAPEALEVEYGENRPRWQSAEEMSRNAFIPDREGGELKQQRERLARYVEVEIRDAGRCERPALSRQE